MCLLRRKATVPKGERQQEYGILVHNMAEDSLYATCLMTDGRSNTLSLVNVDNAFRRIKEDMYKIPPLVKKQLQEMYIAASANTAQLNICIEKSQSDYIAALQSCHEARVARQNKKAKPLFIPGTANDACTADDPKNNDSEIAEKDGSQKRLEDKVHPEEGLKTTHAASS